MKFRNFFLLTILSFSISIFAAREQKNFSCTHVYSPFDLYLGNLYRNGCQLVNTSTGEFIYRFNSDDYHHINNLILEAKREHTFIQIDFSKVNKRDKISIKKTNTNAFTYKKVPKKDIEYIRESYSPFSRKKQYKITINKEEYILFISAEIHDFIQNNNKIPTFYINESACKDPDEIMPFLRHESDFIQLGMVNLADMV